jgi:glycosyltransferase involved in cell wall biosynthesis
MVKNIQIIHINTQKNWRGGERQLVWLYDELKTKGINQIIVCRAKGKLSEFCKKNRINFKSFKISIFTLFYISYQVLRLVKGSRTIIHCHDSKAHTIALIIKLFYRSKVKVVVQRKVNFPIKGYFSQNIKYSERYINAIFCVSKSVETNVLKSTKFRNTHVIYDMIKPVAITNSGLCKEKITIGYIAALTAEKDHYTFLETAKIILENDKNFDFVIAGEGELKQNLIDYSISLGIEKNILFLGFVEDIPALISTIDILLFTSTSEGLGSTILDFFMAKKPVVTVKNGGSEELVFNNITGFICDPKDTTCLASYCIEISKNTELKNTITKNAFEFVTTNFTAEKITTDIICQYNRLLEI